MGKTNSYIVELDIKIMVAEIEITKHYQNIRKFEIDCLALHFDVLFERFRGPSNDASHAASELIGARQRDWLLSITISFVTPYNEASTAASLETLMRADKDA